MSLNNHKHIENKSLTIHNGNGDAGEYLSSCTSCLQDISMSYYYDDDRGTVFSKWK